MKKMRTIKSTMKMRLPTILLEKDDQLFRLWKGPSDEGVARWVLITTVPFTYMPPQTGVVINGVRLSFVAMGALDDFVKQMKGASPYMYLFEKEPSV
jgi:hypothetical protein